MKVDVVISFADSQHLVTTGTELAKLNDRSLWKKHVQTTTESPFMLDERQPVAVGRDHPDPFVGDFELRAVEGIARTFLA